MNGKIHIFSCLCKLAALWIACVISLFFLTSIIVYHSFLIKVFSSFETYLKLAHSTPLLFPLLIPALLASHFFPKKSVCLPISSLSTDLNSIISYLFNSFLSSIPKHKFLLAFWFSLISSFSLLVLVFFQIVSFAFSFLETSLSFLMLLTRFSLLTVITCSETLRSGGEPTFANLNSRYPCFSSIQSKLTFLIFLFVTFFIPKTLSTATVPSVYSLYPSLGPISGGTACLLTGSNFESNSTYCNFISSDNSSRLVRGVDATSSSVICESPPSASKSVIVEVITEQGRSSSQNKIIFLYTGSF